MNARIAHSKLLPLLAAIAIGLMPALPAQAEGEMIRTELKRADLTGVEGIEVAVARLEMQPGASIPRHFHWGDEHVIVLQGGEVTSPDGKVTAIPDGAAMHFPAEMVHGGFTVTGETTLVLHTIHIVQKGKPLMNPVD